MVAGVRRGEIFLGGVLAISLVTTGCRVHASRMGAGSDEASQGSIVAAVEGVSPEALALKPSFVLLCDGRGKKEISTLDGDKVVFKDASDIQEGDSCAMEVRLPEPEKVPQVKNWQWYGYDQKNKIVGLLYGSNFAKVSANRELSLELYKLYSEPTPNLGITPTPDGPCLRYENAKCMDRRAYKLDGGSRVLMRVLTAKDGDTSPTAFIITSGDAKGVGVMPKGDITADALTKAFSKAAGATLKVNVFKDFDVVQKIFGLAFDQGMVEGKPLAPFVAQDQDFKDHRVLAIDKVWIHGWQSLPDSHELDKLVEPRWLAKVTAKNDKEKVEFIVTGAKKYFQSTTKAKATRNGQSYAVYYAWPEVLTDVSDGASDLWRVYAISDGGMVPSTCKNAPPSYYLSDLGGLTLAELGTDKAIAPLDACEIKGKDFRADLKTWSVQAQFFSWRWSSPS